MPFRHYLEDEDDKPYFTQNSLAFYYEDMERKQKLIESLAKNIAGYDIRLTENLETIEKEVDRRLADWDKQLERFPDSVEGLLTKWSTDGTIDTVIQTALIDEKIEPLTVKLAEKASKEEVQALANGSPRGVFPTLAELRGAHPTGSGNIYVVSANGNWYYWNNTDWVSGGVYQTSVSTLVNMLVNSKLPTSINAAANGSLHIRANGQFAQFSGYYDTYQVFPVITGNKYYTKISLKPESVGNFKNIRLIYSDGTDTQVDTSKNEYGFYSGVLTAAKTLPANFAFVVGTAGNIVRENQLLVNLTALFGVGNEPTKEGFDRLLSAFPDDWFDTVNQFDKVQSYLLKLISEQTESINPNRFVDNDTGKQFEYSLRQENGFVVFNYEEVT